MIFFVVGVLRVICEEIKLLLILPEALGDGIRETQLEAEEPICSTSSSFI